MAYRNVKNLNRWYLQATNFVFTKNVIIQPSTEVNND